MPSGPLKICVCGGGSNAHLVAAFSASNPDAETRILDLNEEEAKKWENLIDKKEMVLSINEDNGTKREVKAKPRLVTSNPKEALNGCDLIILTTSAMDHGKYLQAIEPFASKNTVIVGLPGKPGFEYLCYNILGSKADLCTFLSFEEPSWSSKIVEFGNHVEALSAMQVLVGSIVRGRGICRRPPLMCLQMIHGSKPLFRPSKHFLEVTLMPNTFFCPVIIYGQWGKWDGKPVSETPLFYHGMSKETAEILNTCSQECLDVARAITTSEKVRVDLTGVQDLYQWCIERFKGDISNNADLYTTITTNKQFADVRHTMKEVDGGLVPDFGRLVEDLEAGLVVIKGIALLMEVPTPKTDELIGWCQEKVGKEYLVNGELTGNDVATSRCPQRFGLCTIEALVNGKIEEH
ncbi:octopine dehydrogenase-like [Saccostrea echinata]|uniref:octopine dehydrogenase-like n=1 Tax=Saccostrea echinata TaxID=191078 RepID=UPI002A81A764|nr:octopine dehydrogenase-like [Saccostrea echinata]